MEKYIGVKELRQNLNKYASQVRAGRSFVVMKHNKPQFKISPVDADEQWETVIDFTKISNEGIPFKEITKRI